LGGGNLSQLPSKAKTSLATRGQSVPSLARVTVSGVSPQLLHPPPCSPTPQRTPGLGAVTAGHGASRHAETGWSHVRPPPRQPPPRLGASAGGEGQCGMEGRGWEMDGWGSGDAASERT